MKKILPVGSIVEVQGKKVMLLGPALQERDGKMVRCYYAVGYPRGIVTMKSMGILPESAIEKVWHEGYQEEAGEKYLKGLNILYNNLDGKPQAEAQQILKEAQEQMKVTAAEFRAKQRKDGEAE